MPTGARRRRPLLIGLGLLVAVAGLASRAAAELTLQGATSRETGEVLRLQLPSEPSAQRITLRGAAEAGASLRLHVTPFRGEGGAEEIPFRLAQHPERGEAVEHAGVPSGSPVLDLQFDAPGLAAGAERTAELSAFVDPPGASKTWTIVLAGPTARFPGQTLRWLADHRGVFAAGVLILLGILTSYTSETWTDIVRRRHAIQTRIAQMRPAWLRAEPSWPPVIRVKAMLKQAEDRARNMGLTGSKRIEENLEQAERMLGLLRKARRVRVAFQESPMPQHPFLVRFRARALLRGIMRGVGMESLDGESAARFQAELDELEAWTRADELPANYIRSVSRSIDLLLMEIRLDGFPDEHRPLVTELEGKVRRGSEALRKLISEPQGGGESATDPAAVLQTVEHFAALRLLWERRAEEEYATLIEYQKENRAVRDFFEVADKAAWKRLHAAHAAGELQIRTPQITGRELEAFEPIRFEVHTGTRTLDMTHLFHYELDWQWKISIKPRRGPAIELTPLSTEPEVMQYAPVAGELAASVQIACDGVPLEQREIEVRLDQPLHIAESQAFRSWKALMGAETLSTIVAAVVAVAVGLGTEYYGSTVASTAGLSGSEYLNFFLWGVGADRVKSFMAKLGTGKQQGD